MRTLRLVHEDACKRRLIVPVLGVGLRELVVDVRLGLKGLCVHAQADPRGDLGVARTLIQLGREQVHEHPPFEVVVGRLEEHRALARVHRRVVKVEFAHFGGI
jgi:hypothetical protein